MLRGITSIALMVCLFAGLGHAKHFDPNDLTTRNLLLEALQSPSPYRKEVKLKEILKIHPDNYYALVSLGEMELQRGAKGQLKAEEYFLLAALAQPYRSEAFLSLAQCYYGQGYAPEGLDYMMMAMKGPYSRPSYEAICLQGQEYLDTNNYYAAVMTFGKAALSRSSPYVNDPFLIRKLYQAAALSPAPGLWVYAGTATFVDSAGNVPWVPYVFAWLVGMDDEKDISAFMDMLRNVAREVSYKNPMLTSAASEKLIFIKLYDFVMDSLRTKVGETEGLDSAISERFKLGKQFFNFGICPDEKARSLKPDLNLYDVFIEASVPDAAQRKQLLDKLNGIRQQALQAVEKIPDQKERGRELFRWLRENLLVTYDMVDGVTAEGVIKDKKYLCLSGAIVYTLMGRDAGLDVNGYVMPGHAYAVLNTDKGEKINVETTFPVKESAEKPAGFDAPTLLAGFRSSDLRAVPDITGEVSPLDLVSYQFVNVGYNKLAELTLNKYGNQLKEVLQKSGLKQARIDQFIQDWRDARLPPWAQILVMAKISESSPRYHAELASQIDALMDDLAGARSFNPLNKEFMSRIEAGANLFTRLSVASPVASMARRFKDVQEKERNKLKKGIAEKVREEGSRGEAAKEGTSPEAQTGPKETEQEDELADDRMKTAESADTTAERKRVTPKDQAAPAEEDQADDQEAIKWPREKQAYLAGIKRLERVVKNHPCSDRLKRILGEYCINVAQILSVAKELNKRRDDAQRLKYDDILTELNRVNSECLGSEPELAMQLSKRMAELL